MIKVDLEPVVDLLVQHKVLVTNLLGCGLGLKCLDLGGCPEFVASRDKHCVVTAQTAEAGVHIGAEYATNNVAQVRHIVHIGQGTRDENVAPIRHGQPGRSRPWRSPLALCDIQTLFLFLSSWWGRCAAIK